MAVRTSKVKKSKTKRTEIEYESIDDEIKRERITSKASGSRTTFTRGIPRK